MRQSLAVVCSLFVLALGARVEADSGRFDPQRAGRLRGTYVRVAPPERQHEVGGPIAGRGGGATIFMNRGGGHYVSSWWDDATQNESSILQFNVDFAQYPYGDRSWNQLMDCMRDLYADFDVIVTDVDPGNTPHVEVIVSGDPRDIGQSDGVAGIAPMACEPIDNAIVYAFAEAHGDDPISICETAGQESAHAFGLDHEMLCSDIMTYEWGCAKSFVDEDASCGEWQARACACGGNTQNSYQYLMSVLGPSEGVNQPPSVSITSPADGATVDPGFAVEVEVSDDAGVDRIELWIDGELADTAGADPWRTHAAADLAPGSVEVEVRAFDTEGAQTSDVIGVDVRDPDGDVDPGDEEDPTEDPGEILPGGVGDECEAAADCTSNACVVEEGYCTASCEDSDCPDGFDCTDTPSGAFCLEEERRDRGCAVTPGETPAPGLAPIALLLGLAALASRRRRG